MQEAKKKDDNRPKKMCTGCKKTYKPDYKKFPSGDDGDTCPSCARY